MRKTLLGLAGVVLVAMLAACGGGGSSNQGVTDHLGGGGVGTSGACTTCIALQGTGGTFHSGSANISSPDGTILYSVTPPLPAQPTPLSIPENELVNFQANQSSEIYLVASSTATVTFGAGFSNLTTTLPQASGTNNSITLITDASGNLSSVAFSIAVPGSGSGDYTKVLAPGFTAATLPPAGVNNLGTPGVYDSASGGGGVFHQWGGQVTKPTLTSADIAAVFNGVNASAGTTDFMFSQITGSGNLTSGAYGIWMNNDGASVGRVGVFAIGGTPLLAGTVSGSATYTGKSVGLIAGGGTLSAFTANISLMAVFSGVGANTVTTTIDTFASTNVASQAPNTAVIFPVGLSLTGTQAINIASGSYQGSIAGGGYTGTLKGGFSGAVNVAGQPIETVGTWSASNGSNSAIGSYGAR